MGLEDEDDQDEDGAEERARTKRSEKKDQKNSCMAKWSDLRGLGTES